MLRHSIILLFFYSVFPLSFAYGNIVTDSLKNLLKTSAEDTNKVVILYGLCLKFADNEQDKALQYGNEALALAEQLGYKHGSAASLSNIGIVYYYQGNYKSALKYYRKALKINKDIGDKPETAKNLSNLGLVYMQQGNYVKALNYYLRALKLKEYLLEQSRNVGAIRRNKKALASTLNHIANIYYYQDNYDKTIDYLLQAAKIAEEVGDKEGMANYMNNTGSLYYDKGEFEKAIQYYSRSLEIQEELGNKRRAAMILGNIGAVYVELGNNNKALEYFLLALSIKEETGDKETISITLSDIGQVYSEQGNYKKAIEYLQKGLTIAKETGLKDKSKIIFEQLAETCSKQGDYKMAYKYHQLYAQMKDTLLNEESTRQIAEMQTKYDTEKKEKKNELLIKNKAINESKIKKQKLLIYFSISGILVVLCFSFILYNQNRKRKKSNIELAKAKEKAVEADRLKSVFLANMSHEIRTPMNGIIGFVDLLNKPALSAEKRKEFLDIISNNCDVLLNLIDDIIDIAKIEANQIGIKVVECNLDILLFELFAFYEDAKTRKKKKHIELRLKKAEGVPENTILTDPDRLRQVLSNLISNALKFTESGFIEFGYNFLPRQCREKNSQTIQFFVKDTGIGLSDEQMALIFDRFTQADDSTTKKISGAGLGLAISKGLVELLGGKIWVESTPGKGSSFYFTLPYKPSGETIKYTPGKIETKEKYDWDDKVILIAEDEDTGYKFIEEALQETNAQLLHAKNGKQAVELCKLNKNIDLILMDIQLPELDGYMATQQIKQFRKELPVIAQTAYALSDEREKCLKAGCVDYLAKPYIASKLLAMISKYI